ncbi:MAG: UbiX family flavin prenyltransferase [Rikenellaceae bacterium]
MKVIVAITAASGAIYARQALEMLIRDEKVSRIAVIYSANAAEVVAYEKEQMPQSAKITIFDNADMFAAVASGSAGWDAMLIAPCSAGTMSRIACGISDTLITRAADVMLKERRRLVLLLRETPLSLIHLRNMVAITEAGAIVAPAAPNFYHHPTDIEQLALSVTSRAIALLGANGEVKEWE